MHVGSPQTRQLEKERHFIIIVTIFILGAAAVSNASVSHAQMTVTSALYNEEYTES